MILLVCGGRDYVDYPAVCRTLDPLKGQITVLIQGGARGADSLAAAWAQQNGVHCATVPALWKTYGKAAGYNRNRAMLALRPDRFIAFPGGRGTLDMATACRSRNIPGVQL